MIEQVHTQVRYRVAGIILLLSLLIVSCARWLNPSSHVNVTTTPVSAEVWLDGQFWGNTPLILQLSDRETHQLELKSPGYLPVTYALNGSFAPNELPVKMFLRMYFDSADYPGQKTSRIVLEDDTTDCKHGDKFVCNESVRILTRIAGHSQTPSWEYWGTEGETLSAFYPRQPEDSVIIARQRVDQARSETDEYPWGLVFAPDGETVAYITLPAPLVRCVFAVGQIWIAQISSPTSRQAAFQPQPDMGCSLSYGFSPDGRWLWIVYQRKQLDFAQFEYPLRLISVVLPQNEQVEVGYSDHFSLPVWSPNGRWVSFATRSEAASVYHFENGQWRLADDGYIGQPVGWSADNYTLWMLSHQEDSPSSIHSINMRTGQASSAVSLGVFDAGINTFLTSPHGELFAFSFLGRDSADFYTSHSLPGHLLLKNSVTNQQQILKDDDYILVFYWFSDGKRLATLVERPNMDGNYQAWMKIIDVPAALLVP